MVIYVMYQRWTHEVESKMLVSRCLDRVQGEVELTIGFQMDRENILRSTTQQNNYSQS